MPDLEVALQMELSHRAQGTEQLARKMVVAMQEMLEVIMTQMLLQPQLVAPQHQLEQKIVVETCQLQRLRNQRPKILIQMQTGQLDIMLLVGYKFSY